MTKARILVVDDEPQAREILSRLLERRGHLVSAAASAEEARRLAPEGFDLILLDHVLPGATGLETLRELGRLGGGAPVYLMSGYSDPDFQVDARLAGAAGFLSKPLDFPAVEALVDSLQGGAP